MPRRSVGVLGIRRNIVSEDTAPSKFNRSGSDTTARLESQSQGQGQPQRKRRRLQDRLSQVRQIPFLQEHHLQQLEELEGLPALPSRDNDTQSLRFLSHVAIKPINSAISVTNDILEAIETAPPDDPILDAFDHDDAGAAVSEPEELYEMLEDVLFDQADKEELPQQEDFGAEEEEIVAPEESEPPAVAWGLPPTRRSSTSTVKDDSEPIPHKRSATELDPFTFAFGMWCEVSKITRHQYQSLLEVLSLAESVESLRTLPGTITTLKKYVKEQLPLLPLRRKMLDLHSDKLPTMTPDEKAQEDDIAKGKGLKGFMYFFDAVELFRTVVASAQIRGKMHIGPANFVQKPSELYHSMAWATSILSCSGQYATYPNGNPIFPSDVISYCCGVEYCDCATLPHLGRVFAVGKDFTGDESGLDYGKLVLQVQRLYSGSQFPVELKKHPWHRSSTAIELLLAHRKFHMVAPRHVVERIVNIHFDYRYEGIQGDRYPSAVNYTSQYVVRNTVIPGRKEIDPLQLSSPPRGELELARYGRPHLEQYAAKRTLSIPLLIFIDAFGVYRNMYRSLMGIYATIAAMDWRERKRRANVFPLTLGPYASDFSDVIQTLTPDLTRLHEGHFAMDVDGEETIILAYPLAFTGDMPQQALNGGFMSPLAKRGCSKCLVTKDQRSNLTFDVYHNARVYHRVVHERAKGDNLARTSRPRAEAFFNSLGMRSDPPPLVAIAPALDLIRGCPTDAAHSEYAGIAKQSIQVLFDAILTKEGQLSFCATLQGFPFPPGWAKLQSPLHHLKSYRMQECARLSIITPILLRTWLSLEFIEPHYVKAIQATMVDSLGFDAVDCVVHCYAAIARSNAVILSLSMSSPDRDQLEWLLKQNRKSFQRLFECATIASTPNFKRGQSPRSQMQSTPLVQSQRETSFEDFLDELSSQASIEEDESDALVISQTSQLRETFTIDGANKKALAFYAHLSRPNVHIALHFSDVAGEYATPNNCTTFTGEDKHRGFKAAVTRTNKHDIVKTLLMQESLQQCLRFLLAGSYLENEPQLSERMERINKSCPSLLRDLLPYSEQNDDAVDDEAKIEIVGDAAHEEPLAIGCVQASYVTKHLRWPVRSAPKMEDKVFSQLLRDAYDQDYNEPNVTLPKTRIQWCMRISFTDP